MYHRSVMLITAISTLILSGMKAELPDLRVDGSFLRDPAGNSVILKGANVGNWFVIEPWMLGLGDGSGGFGDQYEMEALLEERFGKSERDSVMELYRKSWIKESDFAEIKAFGFNAIRLPLNYRMFEDDDKPFALKPEGFVWVDRVLEWATKHGLYVILDMHGVQGGQSPYDHTGRSGQNKLWTEPQNELRLAWLWGEFAKRYRGNGTVAAYDVFNEPYGGTHEGQKRVFSRCYEEIRKFDKDTMILAMGHTNTFTHYGTPDENGWKAVGYQMHYYPGMFGNGDPTLMTQAKHLRFLGAVQEEVKRFDAPFLVGEMNVVFDSAGGGAMMRRTYDLHAKNGWHTTMWSYKVINSDGGHGNVSWGMVANKHPVAKIDFRTASLAEIRKWIHGLGSMEIVRNEGLFRAMTSPKAPVLDLPALPPVRRSAPDTDTLPGWEKADIGGAIAGGFVRNPGASFDLFGGGSDIWGGQDQFRFLHRGLSGDGEIEVEIEAVEDVHGYTKAGLMLRSGLDANAAHAMLTVFPSGEVQFAYRKAKGETTDAIGFETKMSFPGARLRLKRQGKLFSGFVKSGDGNWQKVGEVELDFPLELRAGVLALSHESLQLAKVSYRDLAIRE